MNRKITPFSKALALVLTVALVAMMVAPALAASHVAQSNPVENIDNSYNTFYATATGKFIAIQFQGNNEYLAAITIYVENTTAACTGTLYGRLFNTSLTGTNDTAGVHDSTNSYTLATFDETGRQAVTVNFSKTFLLETGTTYYVAVWTESPLSAAVDISATTGPSAITIPKNGYTNNWGSALSVYATHYIYTDPVLGGIGIDSPGGDGFTGTYDELINAFTSFIVPLVVMLLPAFILCFMTRRVDKWLLLIGLAIGAGLGYYFGLVPLWLVFLVTIGLIGMAYQAVRGGGAG